MVSEEREIGGRGERGNVMISVVDELASLASEVMEVLKKKGGEKQVADRMITAMKESRELKDERRYDW